MTEGVQNRIGYCRYHRTELTARQMRQKGCLHKPNISNRCRHFVAFMDNPYWIQRANIQKKKAGKLIIRVEVEEADSE